MKNKKIKEMVLLSLFIAIEVALISIPFLGYIPIGPLRATTLHIPVLIAAIMIGKKGGMIIGLVFGLSSLFYNTINPTITSFVFSPFISKNIISAFIAIVPRVLIGYLCATIHQFLQTKKINQHLSILLSSFIATITNTILVLSGIYMIFGSSYSSAIGIAKDTLLTYLISIVATQGFIEAICGCVITLFITRALLRTFEGN